MKIYRIYISVLIISLIGCSLKYKNPDVSVSPQRSVNISPNDRILILPNEEDKLGVYFKLEHALLSIGFNVVSQSQITETINVDTEETKGLIGKRYSSDQSDKMGVAEHKASSVTLSTSRKIPSDYIVKYNYSYDVELIHYQSSIYKTEGVMEKKKINSFSASIVSVENGRIIVSANYNKDRYGREYSIEQIINEFKNKLSDLIKN